MLRSGGVLDLNPPGTWDCSGTCATCSRNVLAGCPRDAHSETYIAGLAARWRPCGEAKAAAPHDAWTRMCS